MKEIEGKGEGGGVVIIAKWRNVDKYISIGYYYCIFYMISYCRTMHLFEILLTMITDIICVFNKAASRLIFLI
jgi:hypothetical protein